MARATPAPVGSGEVAWCASHERPYPARIARASPAPGAPPRSSTRKPAPSPSVVPEGWLKGAQGVAESSPSAWNPAKISGVRVSVPPATTRSARPSSSRSRPRPSALADDEHAVETVTRGPRAPIAEATCSAMRCRPSAWSPRLVPRTSATRPGAAPPGPAWASASRAASTAKSTQRSRGAARARHHAADVHREALRREALDRPDAVAPRGDRRPEGRRAVPERGDRAHAGDRDVRPSEEHRRPHP